MELDSPSYSPTEFMTLESQQPIPTLDIGPSRSRSRTGSNMGVEDMQLSSVGTPTPPNRPKSLPYLPLTTNGDTKSHRKLEKVRSPAPSVTPSAVLSTVVAPSESHSTKMNVTRKSRVPNPFVSAGFMTEFAGPPSGQKLAATLPSKVPVEKVIKIEVRCYFCKCNILSIPSVVSTSIPGNTTNEGRNYSLQNGTFVTHDRSCTGPQTQYISETE